MKRILSSSFSQIISEVTTTPPITKAWLEALTTSPLSIQREKRPENIDGFQSVRSHK